VKTDSTIPTTCVARPTPRRSRVKFVPRGERRMQRFHSAGSACRNALCSGRSRHTRSYRTRTRAFGWCLTAESARMTGAACTMMIEEAVLEAPSL
jgi:hypothetical protein